MAPVWARRHKPPKRLQKLSIAPSYQLCLFLRKIARFDQGISRKTQHYEYNVHRSSLNMLIVWDYKYSASRFFLFVLLWLGRSVNKTWSKSCLRGLNIYFNVSTNKLIQLFILRQFILNARRSAWRSETFTGWEYNAYNYCLPKERENWIMF